MSLGARRDRARRTLRAARLAAVLALSLASALALCCDGSGAGRRWWCRPGDGDRASTTPEPIPGPTPTPTPTTSALLTPPDPALVSRGRALVERFECNRCHILEGIDPPARSKDCVGCHRALRGGAFGEASADDVATWASHLRGLVDSPSLVAMGARLDRGWVASFLVRPHDLRPRLVATMPRLALTEDDASAVAAFLCRDVGAPAPEDRPPPDDDASLARGRALFSARGCVACHRFADREAEERAAPTGPLDDASRLAPDLSVTRARFRPERLARWIADPVALKPDTRMPSLHLSADEARALAAYVLHAALVPDEPTTPPPLLGALARRVTYEEVNGRVFSRTCRHCHADPDFALGDGGPGNDGGFGFPRRGLNLLSYEGAANGVLVDGARTSIFAPDASGLPRLVHALRARQLEEAGVIDPEIRGMPLAHPALSAEELQLVTTWIAQGRPRE